ncbi:extracellular solute-binding protein [Tuberibacillus sp. Marseille-P3662]|uniref:extracellular solute-binding protein n=1 Tax=Tuberibacillus sp. Marseille-P3662 TaxID=1965358 RepID=UPI000A1CD124|nr:extracellular solute-binding protein [Tuberibacillus sp. Marseille-P3662]
MKKRKNIIYSVLFILSVSIFLGGCSDSTGSSDSENESVTINAIFPSGSGTEDALKGITKKFEDKNPNIHVNLEFVAYNSLKQKILTSAKSGNYDVTDVDMPWIAQFANAGILQAVPEELSKKEENDIFGPFIEGVTYNEKMYAMPWKNDTKFLYYNKDMLKKAGFNNPPETWEELRKQAKAIKEQGIVNNPIVWSWSQSEALVCDFVVLTGGFNGNMIKEGQPNFTSDHVLEATSYMVNSLESGLSNPNSTEYLEQEVQETFIHEKAAFALNWSFMYNEVKNSNISDKLGVTVVPGSENVKSSSVYGGEGLGITSGSEHPEAAWKYIKFLTSKDVQKNNVDITLPIWKSLYESEKVLEQNPELVKVASQQFNNMISRPKIPSYGKLSQEIQVNIQEILTGNKGTKEGLSELQNKAESITSND